MMREYGIERREHEMHQLIVPRYFFLHLLLSSVLSVQVLLTFKPAKHSLHFQKALEKTVQQH